MYQSIKNTVLMTLERELPTLREKFGVAKIGIFGSVSRGEDTPDSDIDMLVSFVPEYDSYYTYLDLADYLETLFGRSVELLTTRAISPYIKPYIDADMILYIANKGTV